jgi:hypothetical protein
MKLFISYRRDDSTHAAHRVRMCLQAAFGTNAVFIDREIPAGQVWEKHLETMLAQCSGVVVLIGNDFMRRLRRSRDRDRSGEEPDQLLREVEAAIRQGKPIYPVVFGSSDMPDARDLPESIRALAGYQAVFAREPAFDAAMSVLIKSVAQAHDLQELPEAEEHEGASARPLLPANSRGAARIWLATTLLAPVALWWLGRLILWLADPLRGPTLPAEAAFWHGTRFVLVTAVWGVGPYLAYWMVAELRARARLPIYNLHGLLSVGNMAGMAVSGGTFLLLSSLPGWRLQPLGVFPAQPGPLHYVALSLGLLAIVLVVVAVAIWEPRVRSLPMAVRSWWMGVINTVSGLSIACGLWFMVSMAASVPPLGTLDPVPVVGYFMLSPTLSLLLAGWQYARAYLGLRERDLRIRCLFGIVIGLYLVCTLALFAFGPMRLLADYL